MLSLCLVLFLTASSCWSLPAGYDSVIGREGQRGIDEWVFFRQDQLLLCFLVDEHPGRTP